jgi:hypothetical protein
MPNRPPLQLKGVPFRRALQWLSKSQQAVAQSRPGEQVPLPPAAGCRCRRVAEHGAKATGIAHAADGSPCQDAFTYAPLGPQLTAIAVADGAGSAIFSKPARTSPSSAPSVTFATSAICS